ncbi:maltogenic amylase-like enzyme [Neobacillus bataviensis]|uniref:Maltogenic amylase-like enzyme n=1 Tax=Neobacillus bataviensis TaxID=220685 RepID=A0A561CTM8_9BACI|nr:maltogenic amylase-like enzyme [Neobacillus bataviensis]
MIWDEEEQNLELFHTVQKLILLRKEHTAFGNEGKFMVLETNNSTNHIIYSKQSGDETIIITINNSTDKLDVTIPYDFTGKSPIDLWNNKPLRETSKVELSPYGFAIIQVKN